MKSILLVVVGCGLALCQSEAPVIDGRLNDPFWKKVTPQPLAGVEPGVPGGGGEVRIVVRGQHLLIGAVLPEAGGRITARMMGRHPNWEDEDMLRIVAGPDIGYTDRMVRINPLGAYSVEREGQVVHANAERYLVATSVNETGWTVEFAFPLSEVSAPGPDTIRASVERVRAARPDAPVLRWRWPLQETASLIRVDRSAPWESAAPVYRPAPLRVEEPPLTVTRGSIPAREAGWQGAGWREVTAWPMLRHEPQARAARLASEVKGIHDGRTLALLARFAEPGSAVADVRENDARVETDDSFQVYLATTGSSYVQLAVNPAGYLLDLAGKTGGPRISRPRTDWDSGAVVTVTREPGAWLARLDIPMERAAAILGEAGVPQEFRVLLMRNRVGRAGEPRETSAIPVVLGETAVNPARYRRLVLKGEGSAAAPAAKGSARNLASLESNVLTAAERRGLKIDGMLDAHVRSRVLRKLEAEAAEWKQVESRAGWERFRDRRLGALRAFIGPMPERIPLEMHVGKEYRGQGYRRLDIVYRSRPTLWIAANLYLPDKPQGRRPALIIIPSHHRPRWQPELQDMGILWARAGSVVLVPDNLSHGERIQTYPWNREGYHARYNLGMQLYAAGESLIKWMVWDTMRGVDLLLERSDVDPSRIVLLGAVAGGGDPAAVTAALDPRIAAVAPFNFGEATPRTSGRGRWPVDLADPGWGSWESTRNMPGSISGGFVPWVVCASVAPRRFIYSYEMGWDVEQQPAWARYRKVFSLYNAGEHLDEAHGFGGFPGPGECSNIGPSQRKTMYPELERWFGIPAPAAEPKDRRPESELRALTPLLTSKLKMQLAHEVAREMALRKVEAVRSRLSGLDAPGRVEWLRRAWREKLGDIDPGAPPVVKMRWTKQLPGIAADGVTLEVEPGVLVPMLLLRPATATGRARVVVGVSQGGKERMLADHGAEIEDLLQRGIAVCLPDVRGAGETAPDTRRGPSSAEVTLAATELMMGNSLLGSRLKDLRVVLAYLATRADIDAQKMGVWGDSYAPSNAHRLLLDETPGWQMGPQPQYQAEPLGGLLALFAALYEPRVKAVAIRRGLADVASILEDRFAYVPGDVIVPGMLEAGDLADVAGAITPRRILLEGLVDCRNRIVPDAEVRRRYEGPLKNGSGTRTIRSQTAPAEISRWMAEAL
ncbi:MAG TPA: acetylxylan esterase [Bryobacteraceae bacterium]|nr:acetylxylan esterase [Bryobacteraceae bacterium]